MRQLVADIFAACRWGDWTMPDYISQEAVAGIKSIKDCGAKIEVDNLGSSQEGRDTYIHQFCCALITVAIGGKVDLCCYVTMDASRA